MFWDSFTKSSIFSVILGVVIYHISLHKHGLMCAAETPTFWERGHVIGCKGAGWSGETIVSQS